MTLEEQKLHFDTFGFLVKQGLFSTAEVARFSAWFNEGFARYHGPLDSALQIVQPGLQLHPGLCQYFFDDARILDTLDNLMGEDYLLMASDAQRRAGSTYWHQDTNIPMEEGKVGDYLMMKIQLYFDDLSSGEGSLWVLPGSHRKGYHYAMRELLVQCDKKDEGALTPAGVAPMDLPGAIPVKTKPGDIVFFNQKLAHSSWGGSSGRRFLGVTMGEKPTEEYHLEWIMQHANRWKEVCMNDSKTQFPKPLTEHSSPRLRQAIKYLCSRGF